MILSFVLISIFCVWLQRITISEILKDEWFRKGYKHPVFDEKYDANLDDVTAAFKELEVRQRWVSTNLVVSLILILFLLFNLDCTLFSLLKVINISALLSLPGSPCDWKERRATCSYECIWTDFNVKGIEPRQLVWHRAGAYTSDLLYLVTSNSTLISWTVQLVLYKIFVWKNKHLLSKHN